MEVLPKPITAQGVARAKGGGHVVAESTEAGHVVAESTEAGHVVAESTEPHGVAESTKAQVAEEAPSTDMATLVAKSPYLKILKTSVNFQQEEFKRKFLVKDFGNLQTALSVAEVFAKRVSHSRFHFEQVSKKPEARMDLLKKFGWPADKSCKRDLKAQQAFMMNSLCNQGFQQLEADLLLTLIRCSMGPQAKNCYLTHKSDGFHARVKPKEDVTLEKKFDTLQHARKWIEQLMAVEEREGGVD